MLCNRTMDMEINIQKSFAQHIRKLISSPVALDLRANPSSWSAKLQLGISSERGRPRPHFLSLVALDLCDFQTESDKSNPRVKR